MKKALSLILALVLCLSLCACDSRNETPETTKAPTITPPQSNTTEKADNTITNENNSDQDSPFVVCYEDRPWFNLVKFKTDVEIIELTVDNWKNYIKVCSYDRYLLGAGKERYHCFENVVLELKTKETGEVTTYEFDYSGCGITSDFNLDTYECTEIEGYLYYLNFPEDALAVYDSINLAYIEEDGDVSPQPAILKLDPETNAVEVSGTMEQIFSGVNHCGQMQLKAKNQILLTFPDSCDSVFL